jgi:FkbH-like protein
MNNLLNYPFDCHKILRKIRSIKRELEGQPGLVEKRIAILGGSTTDAIKSLIEIFLLNEGIKPLFYESEYEKYFEDIIFDNHELEKFNPDFFYIHTSMVNITYFPKIGDAKEDVKEKLEKEISKWKELWGQIELKYNCPIIQNNFEFPPYRSLGSLDSSDINGRSHFILELNQFFSECSRGNNNFHVNDIFYLSSRIGLDNWHDRNLWFTSKYAMSYDALPLVAYNLSNIIKALLGNNSKCLVLDLDNTIWGGIIGEHGLGGLEIGKETPIGEAFTEFQTYVKTLNQRGVILAVCSKNDLEVAKKGFSHPDSVLQLKDITVFKANWEPKHENIKSIAKEINIDLGSLVFLDDSPAERDIVSAQTPSVKVPNLGNDVARYVEILDRSGYFETISISAEDLKRNRLYGENIKRQELVSRYKNYDEFLASLEMKAEIKPFSPVYLDRITQLVNKTNQFNLTTKRYTFSQIEAISRNPQCVALYGRLTDKFGDNGLVSVMIGDIRNDEIQISLWLMSCRVIKRGMEYAMFDHFVRMSIARGIKNFKGIYLYSAKNGMVSGLYSDLGFERKAIEGNGDSMWERKIPDSYENRNHLIEVLM